MNYFITGGTGFIGRFLIPLLLDRGGKVYMLTRKNSLGKVDALRALWGVSEDQVEAIVGDLSKPKLGLSAKDIERLAGSIDHFFHLAAIYDLKADADTQLVANVEGTKHAVAAAKALKAGCFHHTSSIAAGGLYKGTFTEDMFEEATGLDHPYYRTKHDSEGIVRASKGLKWRIYRPAAVVGHSRTGEMDKVDGPYYFFRAIAAAGRAIPSWLPIFSLRGGKLNIVPVDYVVAAMDAIAHKDGEDGKCFHLTSDKSISVGDLISLFMQQAHGPTIRVLKVPGMETLVGSLPVDMWLKVEPVRSMVKVFMDEFGIPLETLDFLDYPTSFDNSHTRAALKDSGVSCPDIQTYAPIIWAYWDANLRDPAGRADRLMDMFGEGYRQAIGRSKPGKLKKTVDGKVVVVTGATSGIGLECAKKLAFAGATVVLAARTPSKLDESVAEITAAGGRAVAYSCDIADLDDCDRFVAQVEKDMGGVDILVNNAGRSIRRSVENSFDRFHDYERTMQLNYFGALRLIMGFAPGMLERREGHIVNISSIGVLASPPRFSAYVASKAALDAFSACAAAEFADRKVRFTTVNMPLVRTPMIAPTKIYNAFPTLTPDEAADMVMKAICDKPKRVATPLGIAGAMSQAVTPDLSEMILNQAYHIFPDSAAARGDRKAMKGEEKPKGMDWSKAPGMDGDVAQRMFSHFFRGIHW